MHARPYKKFMRMVYWMNKQKNLSPWPVPFHLPKDTKELARMAIERITSADRHTEIVEMDCADIEESLDKTWIISGQSLEQREMIARLPQSEALYVEGAFRVWVGQAQVNYFILRGTPVPRPAPREGHEDDLSQIKNWAIGQFHEQDLVRWELHTRSSIVVVVLSAAVSLQNSDRPRAGRWDHTGLLCHGHFLQVSGVFGSLPIQDFYTVVYITSVLLLQGQPVVVGSLPAAR